MANEIYNLAGDLVERSRSVKDFEYEIYDAAGDLVERSRHKELYSQVRDYVKQGLQKCENESTAFIHRVYANGKTGEERKFIVKNGIMLESGLLKPKNIVLE